jgi:5-methylcytosine-specific restriction endonuclease McrA
MTYDEYLQSPEWQERRQRKLRKAGFKCQLCSGKGALDIHHNTYERLGVERETDLIVLCRECHQWHHLQLIVTILRALKADQPLPVSEHHPAVGRAMAI